MMQSVMIRSMMIWSARLAALLLVLLAGGPAWAGTPTTMLANPGTTPQSTDVNTPFATPLGVTVKDAGNAAVAGVLVTFTAPGAGASGIFSNATKTITVATNAAGVASAPITANATTGGPYTVTAAASGLTTVNFSMTNVGPSSMTANAGTTPQSTTQNMPFANALAVTVRDASSVGVVGVAVTFTSPAVGASAIFSNTTRTITVATNAAGVASAPVTANGASGTYTVTAQASGLTTVNFTLTNSAAPIAMTANAGTTPQSANPNTAFAHALAVTTSQAGSPLSGVNVTFTSPASGPSGIFANTTPTITVPTNASGIAAAQFTANGTACSYAVHASDGTSTVTFLLTNEPAADADILFCYGFE